MEKKYFKYLDTLRAILCIAVLLYHLNLLKGGYLAVCCFFALSGYLSCRSLLSKEKVNLVSYYYSRMKKIYLPLLIVVLTTIAIISFIPDLVWVSLKPETTSVLFGYNNFWQIGANLDYFARHTESPFMHLWYIGILLQFELVFPFIFMILNGTKKISKAMPSIVSSILAVGFAAFFWIYSTKAPIMAVYYNTFSRVFSLLFGVAVCFIHSLIEGDTDNNGSIIFEVLFWFVMFCIIAMFVFIDASSKYFAGGMVIVSLLTCVLIECGVSITKKKQNILEKLIKPISDASYEIYLVQYPIIFLYQTLYTGPENEGMRIAIVAGLSLITAFIIHFAVAKRKNLKAVQIIVLAALLAVTGFGGYKYVLAEDHTEEMKLLEQQLAESAAEMEKQKEEFLKKQQEENNAWEELLSSLEPDEAKIKETVRALPVICVGDSVMLGAANNLRSMFPSGYVDAEVSRSGWVVNEIIKGLKINGPVVIHTGTNGDVPEYVKDQMMKACGNNDVFWLTVTNDRDVHVNSDLKKFVQKYENAHLIDWQALSSGHSDWFYSDGIHLPSAGRQAYTDIIFNAIYQVKLDEFNKIKDEAVAKHEQELKTKIGFYGNELLSGIYSSLQRQYPEANFVADKEMSIDSLLVELTKAKQANSLAYRLVFAFDKQIELTEDDYQKILEACADHEVTIVTMGDSFEIDGVKVVSFGEVLSEHKEYYMPDRVHLNEAGNTALYEMVQSALE